MAGTRVIDLKLVGYIPQEENKKFKKLVDENKIYNMNLIIKGGEKKVITKNDVQSSKDSYKVILKVIIKKTGRMKSV